MRSARRPLNDRRPNTAPISNGMRNKGKEKEHHLEPDATGAFSDNENNPVHSDEDFNEHSGFNDDLTENVTVAEIGNDYDDDSGDFTDPADDVEDQDILEEASPSILASDARKLQKKNSAVRNFYRNGIEQNASEELPQSSTKRKRPGRPPKAQSNVGNEESDRRPKKKAKSSRTEQATSTVPLDPELDKVVENYTNRTGPLKGRSLYILKRETPSDEQSTHTRSGRVSVRPLAYWRNERCVYGDGEAGIGQRFPLSTIKEIIRTEELQPEKKKAGRRKSSNKRSNPRKPKNDRSDDDDDDDYADDWEREGGVLHGYVLKWDPESQTGTNEEEVLGMLLGYIFYRSITD
jgi:centromere protein C